SIWYNKTHRRYGTLWAERFKSVLVEPKANLLETLAAYIDLNSVRAGKAKDPKDYRFCGYAEALAGSLRARQGIGSIFPSSPNWEQTQRDYRQLLFGTGASPRESAGGITQEDFERVIREQGRLPLATVLRCRLRYFTDGAVLGTRAYVEAQRESQRRRYGREERTRPRPLPQVTEWGDLAVLRRLRGRI
ncbi:MAG: transposase, partial [Opitutaceae bacterium]|nr:transposase [Opitutaceae bacterium]